MSEFQKGLDLFNEGNYFEAHEIWEDMWLAELDLAERQFLLGLIMTAWAMYRYQKRECSEGMSFFRNSFPLLRFGMETHKDLRVYDFIKALEMIEDEARSCMFLFTPDAAPKLCRSYAYC